MQKVFGIIGFPLSHSFSNRYFLEKFDNEKAANCMHKVFPLSTIEELPALIDEEKNLLGLNVTIPYKEAILPYLDELDERGIRNLDVVRFINHT